MSEDKGVTCGLARNGRLQIEFSSSGDAHFVFEYLQNNL